MKSNFLARPTLIILFTFLLGCTNGTFVPSPVSNSSTQVVAENNSYPTPAATLSELIADLSSDDPIVREVSINALERYGEEGSAAVPQLRLNLYYEESSEVRRSASVALGKLGILAKAASPDLVEVIENDPAPGVVVSALNAIGEIGDASVIPHLAPVLYCDSNFYENRYYNKDSCYQLAILSAEAISKLSGQHFTDTGTGIYTLAEDGTPRIVVDSRKWWDDVGQFEDWSQK
jgi:hypothetical protein